MQRECRGCGDNRLVIEAGPDRALARRCECQIPCSACAGAGYRFQPDADGIERAIACPCRLLDRKVSWFNEARLPARYHAATLQGFETYGPELSEARNLAYRFAREFRPGDRGLLFYGGCGTGKTHLVVAILRYLLVRRGAQVRFTEFMQLMWDLRATFGNALRAEDVMTPLVEVPVLAVDELGKGRGSEWELDVLDQLISRRYNAQRTTLFTTNYAPEEGGAESLEGRVGDRIYSRLREMCDLHPLRGEDYRQRSR